MGTKLISNDTLAPWNSKVVPPITRGLEGWFTFETDANRFKRNRALGKGDAVIVGTPAAFSGYGRFKGLSNYIQTDIAETDEQTLIVVGRAVVAIPGGGGDEFTPLYVGNYRGQSVSPGVTGASYGTNLYHNLPTTMIGAASRNNGAGGATSGPLTLTNEAPTDWGIRVLRTKSGVPSVVQNVTRGSMSIGTAIENRVLTDTKFRIGSGSQGFAGEVDISFVAIHSVYLTDAELSAQIAVIRKRMARLGIAG